MVLPPGHRGPNLKRSSAGEERVPAAEKQEHPPHSHTMRYPERPENAEDVHLGRLGFEPLVPRSARESNPLSVRNHSRCVGHHASETAYRLAA